LALKRIQKRSRNRFHYTVSRVGLLNNLQIRNLDLYRLAIASDRAKSKRLD